MTTSKWVAVGSGSINNVNNGQIGYSNTGGDMWTLSAQTSLFGGGGVYNGGRGVAVDNKTGRWVAVGFETIGNGINGQIGYSDDGGINWTLSAQTSLFGNGYGYGVAVDSKTGRWVAVGYGLNNGQLGYSDDGGETWTLSAQTSLFGGGGGYGVAVDSKTGRWVAVGYNSIGNVSSGQIGYSDDGGETWTLSAQTSLFGNGYGYGVDVDSTTGRWVAAGYGSFNGQIGYSNDGGETWTLSAQTSLFGNGYGHGVAVDSKTGRWVAVGQEFTNNVFNGQIGYSNDGGETWTLSAQTSLFRGGSGFVVGNGYDVAVDSTTGRWVAVGVGTSDNAYNGQIGYSDDGGINWTLSAQTSLFGNGFGYGVAVYSPEPPPPALANICFPAGTLVNTDQGEIAIERLLPGKHTIHGKHIAHITRTQSTDAYLIQIQKGALERNSPDRTTVISKDHKILFKGQLVPADRFLKHSKLVKRVKYEGELLYNVLMAEYGIMQVHNMTCETLDPCSPIACDYQGVTYKAQEAKRAVDVLHCRKSLL